MAVSLRGITLTREIEALFPIPNRGDGFRIRIIASNADLMDENVFVFVETVLDPIKLTKSGEFCAIVSPSDIANIGVGTPLTGASPPYYRGAILDVVLASRQQAEEFWEAIHTQVLALVEALNRKDRLTVADTLRLGAADAIPSISVSVSP